MGCGGYWQLLGIASTTSKATLPPGMESGDLRRCCRAEDVAFAFSWGLLGSVGSINVPARKYHHDNSRRLHLVEGASVARWRNF